MTFSPSSNGVTWITERGPYDLSFQMVDALLDLFDEMGSLGLFLDLYDAAQKADGFIPRGCSVRGFEGWNSSSRSQPSAARDQEPRCPEAQRSAGQWVQP